MALALALTVACGSNGSSVIPTTPAAVAVTETFTGTVAVAGADIHNFTVTQQGTLSVTLTAVGPPSTIFMGLAIGALSGTTCLPISGASVTVQAGTAAQLSGTAAAGAYCVAVVDIGNQTAPVDYSLTVSHT